MKIKSYSLRLVTSIAVAILAAPAMRAVDFHCATAQDVQNALTTAAANGANNTIYLTNGYYIGNFNFNSSGGYNLTIANEPAVTNNTQIVLDGAGLARDMNLANTAAGSFTIQGITFLRDCGSTSIGALRIAGGSGASILVQNCQFLSPTNTSGEGLELGSGLNATVTNCVVTGSFSGGTSIGIYISVAGAVNVQNSSLSTNRNTPLYIADDATAVISQNVFNGNSSGAISINNGASLFSGNLFSGNSGASTVSSSYGGIYSSPIYTNNTFIGNSVSGNNAVVSIGYNNSMGSPVITGNVFVNNSAGGGCINIGYSGYNGPAAIGSPYIANNTFENNSGGLMIGYGIDASGVAIIIGNNFSGNSISGNGGGVNCNGSATICGNIFANNNATGNGGGVYCVPSNYNSANTFLVSSNICEQNSAGTGGGIYITGQAITLQDNLLANNSETSASSEGGGVWVDATSVLYMINNTIFGNTSAGGGGGAAFNVTGTVELLNVYNNIIWGNSANGNGADVWLAGTGQKKIFEFNDVNNMYGVWDISLYNTNVSPQFFNPVTGGDYHFPESSPCANAGTNGAPSQPLTDLDGNLRTNSLGQIDLGCYEFNNTATHPADTNGTFVITAGEFAAYAAAWKSGQSWTNAPPSAPNPNPIPANYVTRAGYLMTNGGAYTNDGSARPTNWKPAP